MESLAISVTGMGMVNPAGIGAQAVAAAVQAGINMYSDSPIMRASNEPYKMAFVPEACLPDLKADAPESKQQINRNALYRRMLKLGKLALSQLTESINTEQSIPLFLAVPEQRCGRPFPALEPVIKDLSSEIDFSLDLVTSRVFPEGRASGINALSEAMKVLLNTSLDSIIVGGIDCFMDVMLLAALDKEGRLAGNDVLGGFVPGEGAAFLVLQKAPKIDVTVSLPGKGDELGHMYSEELCLGNGLSGAISEALNQADNVLQSGPVNTILCSMNGEPAHVKEWGTALIRNSDSFADGFELHHPAESYGDLGAATVPTLISLAILGLETGYCQSPLLVWSASDREQRGAVVISLNKECANG